MGLPNSPEEASKALKRYGLRQVRAGQLEEAIGSFAKALRISPADAIEILDHRAATYCKLGQLQKALEDGRRMIRTDKFDSRGYMRTATVLKHMRKPERCLELYTYSLRTLSKDAPFYKSIEAAKRNLESLLRGPKRLDPFEYLPLEIIKMVLSNLTVKERLIVLRVSRTWRACCKGLPELYRHFDLSIKKSSSRLTDQLLRGFFGLSNYTVKKATLAKISFREAPKALGYLSRCKTLEELRLHFNSEVELDMRSVMSFANLRILTTSPEFAITCQTFRQLAIACPLLERLEVYFSASAKEMSLCGHDHIPLLHLRSLTMGEELEGRVHRRFPQRTNQQGWFWMKMMTRMKDLFPKLEELYYVGVCMDQFFPDLSNHTNLRRFGLINCIGEELDGLILPESLEHASFSGSQLDHLPLRDLPNLKSLVLNSLSTDEGSILGYCLRSCSSLEHLDLESCLEAGLELAVLEALRSDALRFVKDLNLCNLFFVNDSMLYTISEHMPNLKRLNISATQVSGHAIRKLVDSENLNLESLTCHCMSKDRDYSGIVRYVRGKGIQIPVVRSTIGGRELRR